MVSVQRKRIAVAMSGGVDSSVAATLLKNQGYEVHGVFMTLAQPDLAEQVARVCHIADFLNIPLEIVDLTGPFRREVLDYFCTSYQAGKTPNPCPILGAWILVVIRSTGEELPHASWIAGTTYPVPGPVEAATTPSLLPARA